MVYGISLILSELCSIIIKSELVLYHLFKLCLQKMFQPVVNLPEKALASLAYQIGDSSVLTQVRFLVVLHNLYGFVHTYF